MSSTEESSQPVYSRAQQRRQSLICASIHLALLLAILGPVAIWWLVKDARLWAAIVPESSNTTLSAIPVVSEPVPSLVERWHLPGRDCGTRPELCMWCETGDPSYLPEGKDGSEYYAQFLCPMIGVNTRPTHDDATHVARDVVSEADDCDPLAPFCTSKRDGEPTAGVEVQNQERDDAEYPDEHVDDRLEEQADKHSHKHPSEKIYGTEPKMIPDPKANCSAMMWDSILSDCPLIPAPTPEEKFWEEWEKNE